MVEEQAAGRPATTRAASRRRGTAALLLGSLGLAVVAIVLVGGASYFAQGRAANPPSPTPKPGIYLMTEGALEMEMTPLVAGSPSTAQTAHLEGILRQARLVATAYQDLATAVAAGYQTAPDLLVETQGQHYFQPQYFQDAATGRFDPAHPPFLVYNTVQGRPVLSGLLYYLPAATTRQQLAAIFPPSLAGWHRHINVCITGGTSLLDGTAVAPIHERSTCLARGGAFLAQTGWMVHLWLHEPVGRSLFAMDRPQQ
ncbi:MAG TPA: hypothetical protein VHB98_10160 [Chloroflexota bacterium]|jgi:hypothetical protein|nr:hypothetical protein [Chloroflexota bacterium]